MHKNLSIILAVVTCLAISMTACMMGEDIDTIEKKATKKNLGETVSIAAIQGVTVPAPAGTPVNRITDNAQYTGTITWSSSDDLTFNTAAVKTFQFGKTYTATITLTPKTGYTLHMVKANFFTVEGSESTNPANSGVITAEFPSCDSKSAGAAVSAPTLNTRTRDTITINPVSAPGTGQTVEYAISTDNTAPSTGWQTGRTSFSGLTAGTTYYIFARSAGNENYNAGAASSLAVTTLLSVSSDRIEYYWVDEHGSLVTTSGGATSILTGSTLTITAAAGTNYAVKQWDVNGVNTGQSGNTYNFSITTIGNHTVDLFLEKDNMLYNTSITITVGQYLVTFDVNEGTGTAPPPQSVVSAGSSITLPGGNGLSRPGYTFGGWNINASGSGTNYNAGSSLSLTSNITLYAKWNTAYTVTFDVNGGIGTTPPSQLVVPGFSTTLPGGSGLSRTGYTFGGWNTSASGTGINYDANGYYYPTGTTSDIIILYAKWSVTYTVTFNVNGGTGTAPPAQSVSSGSGITLPGGSGLSKTGYTFAGWNTSAAGTGTSYDANDYYYPTSNVTLYAKWSVTNTVTYTVTFNINGGTGTAPPAQSVSSGSGITLPGGSGLSKTGYTFAGWNTSAAGTGTNYDAGSSYNPTGNITLYAKWNTTSSPVGPSNGSEANPYVLTAYTEILGSITSSASGSAVWYSFNVTSGTTYYIQWGDTDNGYGTLDIKVAAYYGNGEEIFDVDTGDGNNTYSFTAYRTGIVKIKVYPLSSGNTGTFSIYYY